MPLEDHLGDIVRKGRQAAGLDLAAAARAAGLAAPDYAQLEATGDWSGPSRRPNLRELAELLRLSPGRLQAIAEGWLPQPRNFGLWRELHAITTARAGNAVHCYLVWDEVSREAALFDTGWEPDPVLALIADHDLHLRHLFLTHLHEDHVAAMGPLRARFPKLLLHTNSRTAPAHHRIRPNDFIPLGSLRIMNRATPGHAEEGVTYLVGNWPEDAPHVAIVGDTIFAGSIASGFQSYPLLLESIAKQILSLPPDTLLCPGHGPVTTVAEEQAHNPFFGR